MTQFPPINRDKVRLRRSPVFTKRPQVYDIEDGELAVNFNANELGVFIRDLNDAGERRIRKIGPIHFGPAAPNSTAGTYDFPLTLSNGECWVDTSAGVDKYFLKTWNQAASGGAGAWIEVGDVYGRTDQYLDQFKDGEDGDDYIHTDRTRLKINNKTALRGISTTSEKRLVVNENDEFGSGVSVNAAQLDVSTSGVSVVSQTMTPFQTDQVAANTFKYLAHGLFNKERVEVRATLGTTPSPLLPGDYIVINATNDTFQLSSNGTTAVACAGNVYLAAYEEIEIDAEANYFSTGNFAYKAMGLAPADGQIEDGHWDVYHNPNNGNLRVFARAGNTLIEPEGPGLSIEVKNSSATQAIPAGWPVYIVGYDPMGKVAKVAVAKAHTPATMPAMAVAKELIAPGSRGYVVFLGRVEGLNTSSLPGTLASPEGDRDEGRVVYVGEQGGLTFTRPPNLPGSTTPAAQAIAIVLRQGVSGAIVVNNPSAFTGQPPLPDSYVWVGDSTNVATARRLNSDSFQVRTAEGGVVELALASNVKFGGYEFLYDGNASSKVQSEVTSSSVTSSSAQVVVASFNSETYRSAKFLIQVSALNPNNNYEISEILIVHNNSAAHLTQYGTVSTLADAERFGEFDARIATGVSGAPPKCELLFRRHPWVSSTVIVRALRTAILV